MYSGYIRTTLANNNDQKKQLEEERYLQNQITRKIEQAFDLQKDSCKINRPSEISFIISFPPQTSYEDKKNYAQILKDNYISAHFVIFDYDKYGIQIFTVREGQSLECIIRKLIVFLECKSDERRFLKNEVATDSEKIVFPYPVKQESLFMKGFISKQEKEYISLLAEISDRLLYGEAFLHLDTDAESMGNEFNSCRLTLFNWHAQTYSFTTLIQDPGVLFDELEQYFAKRKQEGLLNINIINFYIAYGDHLSRTSNRSYAKACRLYLSEPSPVKLELAFEKYKKAYDIARVNDDNEALASSCDKKIIDLERILNPTIFSKRFNSSKNL